MQLKEKHNVITQKESSEHKMANSQKNDAHWAKKLLARYKKNRVKNQSQSRNKNVTRKTQQRAVPITHRKSYRVQPINRKRGKVSVPLKTKGAELQLPAFPKLQLGWRLISGAIFVLSLFVVISFSNFSTFKVSAINLKGTERLTSEEILRKLKLTGTSILKLQPDQVEKDILVNFPSIREANVSAGLPAKLNVKVIERTPLVLWQKQDESLWIDVEGVIFPVKGDEEVPLSVLAYSDPPQGPTLDLPQSDEESQENVDIEEPATQTTSYEFVQAILALNEYVPLNTQMQYDPNFGLGWQDPQGWSVFFVWNTSEINTKLLAYHTIIAASQARTITPALICLENLHALFYRLER